MRGVGHSHDPQACLYFKMKINSSRESLAIFLQLVGWTEVCAPPLERFPPHWTIKNLFRDAISTARGFPFTYFLWLCGRRETGVLLEFMSSLPSLESGACSFLCVTFVQTMWSPAVCWEPSIFSLLWWDLQHGHPLFLGLQERAGQWDRGWSMEKRSGLPTFFF